MLVLSRRIGERVVIPTQDVVVTVVEVQGDRVRLGFTAPEGIAIHREEVWVRIQGFQEPTDAALEQRTS